MWQQLSGFLKMLATEDDGNSVFCPARVLWLVGGVTFIVLAVALFIVKYEFDYVSFGTGFGTLLGGGGAGVFLKNKGDK